MDYGQIWKHSVSREEAKAVPKIERTSIVVHGRPDPEHINTSNVERHNLTMRMSMRRFTRRTDGFSKKVQNHACAVATYFFHFNFVRRHMTLTKAAGLATRPWSMAQLVGLLEAPEDDAIKVARRRKDRHR